MDKVNEIMSKGSLNELDIKFLMQNKHFLSDKHLDRLGFNTVEKAIESVVVADEKVESAVVEPKKVIKKK